MTRIFIASLLLLTLGACNKPEKNLVGRWAVDTEALAEAAGADKADAEDKKKAVELAKKVAAQMSYEFTDEGKLNVSFGQLRRTGSYKVKSVDGDILTVTTTLKDGDKEKTDDVKIKVMGKTQIEITPADGKSVRFAKQGK